MEELRNRFAAQKRRLNYLSDETNKNFLLKLVDCIQWDLCEVWNKILELLNSFAEVATDEEFRQVLEDVNGLQSIYLDARTRCAAALVPDEGAQLDLNESEVVLPTFKGGYISWIHFRRIFRSCVVENIAFRNNEKLGMLKRLLVGNPLAMIQHEEDFYKCWDLLHKVYHNRREIANALVKEILEFPKLYKKDKPADDVINEFKEIYLGFTELCMFDLWDVLTTNILTACLEEDVVSLWRATLQDGFIPPLDNLLQFLDHYVLKGCSSGEKSKVNSGNCVE